MGSYYFDHMFFIVPRRKGRPRVARNVKMLVQVQLMFTAKKSLTDSVSILVGLPLLPYSTTTLPEGSVFKGFMCFSCFIIILVHQIKAFYLFFKKIFENLLSKLDSSTECTYLEQSVVGTSSCLC